MATSSSKQSSNKDRYSAFVPSPRFLSESPAKNRSASHIVNQRWPSYSSRSQEPPNIADLRSPIPPPPANLYPGSPLAFNVDPGAPFLAAAAPTDDNRSFSGSVADNPGPKGFTGAVVSGIKNVVKRSLRDRSKSQYQQRKNEQENDRYRPEPQFRDSGYAMSSVPIPPSGLPPMPETLSAATSSRHTVHSAHAPSETLLGHAEERYDRDDATMIGHSNTVGKQKTKPVNTEYDDRPMHQPEPEPTHTPAQLYQQQVTDSYRRSQSVRSSQQAPNRHTVHQRTYSEIIGPEDIASPVSANLQVGPNYKQMDLRTPPPSEISLNTYLKRIQKLVSDVNSLPWIAKERVTKDYYPERSRRSDEPKKAPAIVWRSDAFVKMEGYHAEEDGSVNDESFTEWSGPEGSFRDESVKMGAGMRAPRRGSRSVMDLDAEFEGSRTPMPANPPYMTPYVHPRAIQLVDTPMPRQSQPPDSVLFQRGPPPEIIQPPPPPPPVVPPADNRDDQYVRSAPSRPPAPNSFPIAQTPNVDGPPSGPPPGVVGVGTNTPREQLIFSNERAQPPQPQPPLDNQGPNSNNWYPEAATPDFFSGPGLKQLVPTAEFPYLGPNPDWGGIPVPPVFPSSSRPSDYEHSTTSPSPVIPTARLPGTSPKYHPSTPRMPAYPASPTPQSVWEQYPPNDMAGFVPSQYAEHFYGDQYGPGVHPARPPLVPPPITASAGSGRSGRSRRSSAAHSATSRHSRR